MCPGKTTTKSKRTELTFGIPPLGEIHLAEACDDETKLEEAVEVQRGCDHAGGHRSACVCVGSKRKRCRFLGRIERLLTDWFGVVASACNRLTCSGRGGLLDRAMSAQAARRDDKHLCPQHVGEEILPACATTILITGKPAARVSDKIRCQGGPLDAVRMGEPTVLLEGKDAARYSDVTEHFGFISTGEPTVLIGTITAEAKRLRMMQRLAAIDKARRKAATMPDGPEKDKLLAAADNLARNNQAVEHARLTDAVYPVLDADGNIVSNYGPDPEGWTRISSEGYPYLSPSGMAAALYRSDIDGSVVLVFRGSEPGWQDWVGANAMQGVGLPSVQHAEAVALSRMVAAQYGDNLSIAGHSLGGGLAAAGALATGRPADTFNAAGIHWKSYLYYGLNPFNSGNINAYNVDGEVLTSAQEAVPFVPDAVGNNIDMPAAEPIPGSNPPQFQLRPDQPSAFWSPGQWKDEAILRHGLQTPSLEYAKMQDLQTIEAMT